MSRFRLSARGVSPNLFTVVLVVVGIAASGGVAYACMQGGNGCNGNQNGQNCSQQDLAIEWTALDGTFGLPGHSAISCVWTTPTSSLPTDTLSVHAAGLLPGASCLFNATLKNTGKETVDLGTSWSITPVPSNSLCTASYLSHSDNIASSGALAEDHTFLYRASITLKSTAGNQCQHATFDFSIDVIASEASGCSAVPSVADPVAAIPQWDCD
jgi:hypothetical protein